MNKVNLSIDKIMFPSRSFNKIILTDGRDEFIFYGSKEHLHERYQNNFQVNLYQKGHSIIMKLTGLYIQRMEVI